MPRLCIGDAEYWHKALLCLSEAILSAAEDIHLPEVVSQYASTHEHAVSYVLKARISMSTKDPTLLREHLMSLEPLRLLPLCWWWQVQ